jgi:hypothetical protein
LVFDVGIACGVTLSYAEIDEYDPGKALKDDLSSHYVRCVDKESSYAKGV